MPKQDSTLITVILDRSGSMGDVPGMREATIAGFNEFLQGQKSAPGAAQITLVQFDDHYQVDYLAVDIKGAPQLSHATYVPRGGTALLDAIGQTIIQTGKTLADLPEASRPSKVLMVIDTDGKENASREFNKLQIADMIREQTEKYSWEFVFLAANQDAIMTAASMGIAAGSALNVQATNAGVGNKFAAANAYATRSRGATMDGMGKNSFSAEEREANS